MRERRWHKAEGRRRRSIHSNSGAEGNSLSDRLVVSVSRLGYWRRRRRRVLFSCLFRVYHPAYLSEGIFIRQRFSSEGSAPDSRIAEGCWSVICGTALFVTGHAVENLYSFRL